MSTEQVGKVGRGTRFGTNLTRIEVIKFHVGSTSCGTLGKRVGPTTVDIHIPIPVDDCHQLLLIYQLRSRTTSSLASFVAVSKFLIHTSFLQAFVFLRSETGRVTAGSGFMT